MMEKMAESCRESNRLPTYIDRPTSRWLSSSTLGTIIFKDRCHLVYAAIADRLVFKYMQMHHIQTA